MKFIDLFSGIGGFRLGFERVGGYECVWSCDWDKYANQVYRYKFGEENHFAGDVRGVDVSEIPDHDLLCAGFPCQAFSVAGKRGGFEDTRGTLFFEICRIVEAKKPPLLLLENVKGLLSHDKGFTFQVVLESLDELGYWAEWQVLNSKHFGVPQNRERVFLVGHLGGNGGREIFPIRQSNRIFKEKDRRESKSGKGVQSEVSPTIDARYGALRNTGEPYLILEDFYKERPMRECGGLALSSREGKQGLKMATMLRHRSQPIIFDENIDGNIYGRKECPTLRSPNTIWNKKLLDGFKIRRLTPIECERLQGFLDGWTEHGIDERGETVKISDTQRYKMLGNAVTVNVVKSLGQRLKERFNNQN